MRTVLIALSATAIAAVPLVAQTTATPTPAPAATPPGAADPARVVAGTYAVDPNHTQIQFTVDHFGVSNYFGIFGGATGEMTLDPARPSAARVAIEIPIDALVTTSERLNTHLKAPDFFDAARFPTATFRSTAVAVHGTHARISGDLTLRGVTKPVVLDARFTGAGPHPMNHKLQVGFEATTTIKRSDFGVSYGLGLVSDEVPLRITVAFEKQG